MSLRINTNVAALNAYNNLSNNQDKLNDAFSQLSSGLRINKAADDAAGLSISQGLTSQINGMTQAVSNAQDGINVAQIADGAMGTVQDILQRMRTLVVQAANAGTQDSNSLSAIQSEVTKLNSQLGNIAGQTKFGSVTLADGSYTKNFQVGANGGETISLDLSSANVASSNLGGTNMKLNSLNIVNWAATGYTAKDSSNATIAGDAAAGGTQGQYASTESTADLAAIDAAIKTVSSARSSIGAVQNQLNYTVTNLQTGITNVTASRSNLTDADLATEVTTMTQQQILTSAATSVLAQANSAPQAILKLLQ
jgi:flagellin